MSLALTLAEQYQAAIARLSEADKELEAAQDRRHAAGQAYYEARAGAERLAAMRLIYSTLLTPGDPYLSEKAHDTVMADLGSCKEATDE